MKVLWLCNMIPGRIQEHLGNGSRGALWVDHVLSDMMALEEVALAVLAPGGNPESGEIGDRLHYCVFPSGEADVYRPELEKQFLQELRAFSPDVVHIWGTEYAHTLAMVNACEQSGLLSKTVVSIQGLCSVYAGHYSEGLPDSVRYGFTLRDAIQRDNVRQQERTFARRGKFEVEALKKVQHVIGRTPWDEACTAQINPGRKYYFCNETLREAFYQGKWTYSACTAHRVFASSCVYPVKGFHYLLQAMQIVSRKYPDATLTVPGTNFMNRGWRMTTYEKYLTRLTRESGMKERLHFLGKLDAESMKAAFLDANVFALPSTIENSPNSMGEAMLLGVPVVAADVGGVSTMLKPFEEGYVYQPSAAYMLAHHILQVFDMQDGAAGMAEKASVHARKTHDPETNLQRLLTIYAEIGKG